VIQKNYRKNTGKNCRKNTGKLQNKYRKTAEKIQKNCIKNT